MADKETNSEQPKASAKAGKATEPQTKHELIRRASIGGKWVEKGATVSLTEKGRQQFKQEGKIK